MTALVALAPLFAFHFAGGDDRALVEAISSQLKAPVVLLADAKRTWGKAQVGQEAQTRSDLLKLMAERLHLERPREGLLGLSRDAWPREFYFTLRRPQYLAAATEEPEIQELGRAAFSIRTRKASADLASAFPKMSKPVSWHWFFEGCRLWINVDHITERDYVHMVAASIGAEVRETKERYYFDLDPTKYRSRAVALLDALAATKTEDVLMVEDYRYYEEVLNWLDNDRLRRAMAAKDVDTYFNEPMTPSIERAARARIERFFGLSEGATVHPSTADVWQRLSQRGDFTKMTVVFMTKGSFACRIPPVRQGDPATVF